MRKASILTISLVLTLLCSTPIVVADWLPAKRLTRTAGDSICPALAVYSNNTVHLAWSDNTPGNSEIFYRRSVNGGQSWGPVKRLTRTTGHSGSPAIAVDSSNAVHLAWRETPGNAQIFYRRSKDGGATWGSIRNISQSPAHSWDPKMAVDSNDGIHVVWEDCTPGNFEIFHRCSKDGGATWSANKRLTRTPGSSSVPAIAIDSSNVIHVVWHDQTPGNFEIFHTCSKDGGATWSPVRRLTRTPGGSFNPAIAIDSSKAIHLVWEGSTPASPWISYIRSRDGGATWSMASRLAMISPSAYPAVAADSTGIVYVAWAVGTGLYLIGSPNGGTTWFTIQRLTRTSGDTGLPDIAVDSVDNVHLVWQDNTPGNYEIYYKKGIK